MSIADVDIFAIYQLLEKRGCDELPMLTISPESFYDIFGMVHPQAHQAQVGCNEVSKKLYGMIVKTPYKSLKQYEESIGR